MARPIWKGNITFGLVNVPVVLYTAEKRADLHFRLLDSRNHSRVRYERINEQTGEEVPWGEVVKAYEYDGGDYVILNDEDFEKASVEATQTVDIEDFVDSKAIDYVYFDKPYYLVPGKKGEKGYVLLREAMKRTQKFGIAKVVIHARQHLAVLMAMDQALVLNLLRFEQELRSLEDFDVPQGSLKDYRISNKEMEMAARLIENMGSDWQPDKYHDEYRDALMKYIDKKIKSGKKAEVPDVGEDEVPEGSDVINITSLLQESVAQTGKGRKGKGGGKTGKAKGKSQKSSGRKKKSA